ncbi:2-oxoglutarate oxidoreductase [bacterium]|nr:2-oxoglutarate oxidoreductase [bacterium]
MQPVFSVPKCMKKDFRYTFCPGCDHGVAVRLVAESIDELNLQEKTICSTCVGCSVFLYDFLNIDCIEAPHGRACASATGVKRAQPDKFVFTYQGDGDFASIGLAESMHSALRGEKFTAICINNTTYGMTGGQMGPTSLIGQKTTTSPNGRNSEYYGYPIKIAEHIALCEGTAFSARVALDTIPHINEAKKIIKKAFETQLNGLGFSFVEILATCPTNWKMSPEEAHKRIKEEMIPEFPLGIFKDLTMEGGK